MANADTSVAAYTRNVTQCAHGSYRDRIMQSLTDVGPATRKELAARLGVPINCITAPVLQLIAKDLVVESRQVVVDGFKAWELRAAVEVRHE